MRNKALVLLSVLFLGCSTNVIPSNKTNNVCDPQFFKNYQRKPNEIVGIGIAPMNLKGFNAQKQSAIAKALNEIAAQEGVTINSQFVTHKATVNHSKAYSASASYIAQTVDGKEVRAKIVKECKAPDGNYYVLMKAY